MYTCGPTIYDYAHIGNFRTFIFEDILRRYLKFKGYSVTQVMNLTDVDDRTVKASRKEGIKLREYTERYAKAFFEDLDALNIERAEYYPRATEHIKEMTALVKKLIDNGYAYETAGSTYYDISKFTGYGKLSGVAASQQGIRVTADEYGKDEARDFALWKTWDEDDGEVFWETEVGKGRPGWHLECSAMSMKYLGETFDIHAGGVDLIFPHHENEIAQSEAATGKPFVKYWLHAEHLIVEGRKMSKSLGNFYTLRDLIQKGYDPTAIRYLLISAHYRDQLNFTFKGLDQASNTATRLNEFHTRLQEAQNSTTHNPTITTLTHKLLKNFDEAMDQDLNTPAALAALFEAVRDINKELDTGKYSRQDIQQATDTLNKVNTVLGILKPQAKPTTLEQEILQLIHAREDARKRKDWTTADKIRTQLQQKGIILEDTPQGVKWRIKR
ncbi:MAG: cysteine--tRNA ligase [Thaumarchaeota archaeon]|nr:cysteine--tRNA ligase [Nitrososphaerota archaeon]